MSAKFELVEKIEFLTNIMDGIETIAADSGVLSATEVNELIRKLKLFYQDLAGLKQVYDSSVELELQRISNHLFEQISDLQQDFDEHGEVDELTVDAHYHFLNDRLCDLSELHNKV